MKLTTLKLSNFRGYKDPIEIRFDNLTVFVGKNDIGKSTILEAMDIFFNDGKGIIKLDKDDVNKQSLTMGNLETIISASFSELPDEIIIDSTSSTTLQNEFMLNQNGELEIIKKYNNGGKASIYIKAYHPTNPACEKLLQKKNTELRTIINNESIECENLSVNSIMRRAIWDHYSDNLQFSEIEIEVAKEDAKKIWDKISLHLPIYSLFQSDRKNSDGDNEVQDPMKEAVKQILSDTAIQNMLETIAIQVETKLRDVATRTLTKLNEVSPDIAHGLNPVIPSAQTLKWTDVFKGVSISADEDIPINKRGSGVKRLILLSFFRAEAERRLLDSEGPGIIYAIEEPETSQHSHNQKLLINAFKTLSQAENTQVILTTHSSHMVKQLAFDDLRLIIEVAAGAKQILDVEPSILKYPSLNEVNYSAFDEVSEEYHDELYSFLEYHRWLNDYKVGKPQLPYTKLRNDGSTVQEQHILATYIRHQIHHAENTHNRPYTAQELKQSIEEMRIYIRSRAEREGLWTPIP